VVFTKTTFRAFLVFTKTIFDLISDLRKIIFLKFYLSIIYKKIKY